MPRRPLVDLDAVEGIDVDQRQALDIQVPLPLLQELEHLDFQRPEFAVGDDEKITATAGRIEKTKAGKLLVELLELVLAALDPPEFRPQVVQEQSAHDFENVAFARVVAAELPPLLRLHRTLKERPENGRRDSRPIETRAGQKAVPHIAIETGEAKSLGEQVPVDIRECIQGFIKILLPPVGRRVEHGEKLLQVDPQIRAIGSGAVLDEQPKSSRSKMPVHCAKRQNRIRTRNRSRSWPV